MTDVKHHYTIGPMMSKIRAGQKKGKKHLDKIGLN
jgi:hypothetical protein